MGPGGRERNSELITAKWLASKWPRFFLFGFFLKKETRWLSIGADIDRLARLVFISGLEIVREHSRVWVRGVSGTNCQKCERPSPEVSYFAPDTR